MTFLVHGPHRPLSIHMKIPDCGLLAAIGTLRFEMPPTYGYLRARVPLNSLCKWPTLIESQCCMAVFYGVTTNLSFSTYWALAPRNKLNISYEIYYIIYLGLGTIR